MQAEYRCLSCEHVWSQDPAVAQCPACGHLYVKWMNYEEWRIHSGKKKVEEATG